MKENVVQLEQWPEGFLVYLGRDQLEELVVPGFLVSVLPLGSLRQNVARSSEEVKLWIRICFAKHI